MTLAVIVYGWRLFIYMKQSDLLEMIDHCIALCEREKAAGYPGEATQFQIEEVILPNLYELRQTAADRNIPSDSSQRYLLAFGYVFRVWEWHTEGTSELFAALSRLHYAYRDCETLI